MTGIKILVGILLVVGFFSTIGGVAISIIGGTPNGQGVNNIFVGLFIIGIGAVIWHYKKPKQKQLA